VTPWPVSIIPPENKIMTHSIGCMKLFSYLLHRTSMHLIMAELSKDLIAASATPLILSILSVEESYGYQIIKKITEISDDRIHWKEGTLYPVLHKMEKSGIINSKWKVADNGRKRKYYQINKKGKKILDDELDHWRLIFNSLKKLWSEKTTAS